MPSPICRYAITVTFIDIRGSDSGTQQVYHDRVYNSEKGAAIFSTGTVSDRMKMTRDNTSRLKHIDANRTDTGGSVISSLGENFSFSLLPGKRIADGSNVWPRVDEIISGISERSN